jgi:hypothetical protein
MATRAGRADALSTFVVSRVNYQIVTRSSGSSQSWSACITPKVS